MKQLSQELITIRNEFTTSKISTYLLNLELSEHLNLYINDLFMYCHPETHSIKVCLHESPAMDDHNIT